MQVINYFFFRSELFIYSMITEYLIHARKASIAATTARSRQQTNIGSNFLSFLLANLLILFLYLPSLVLLPVVCLLLPSILPYTTLFILKIRKEMCLPTRHVAFPAFSLVQIFQPHIAIKYFGITFTEIK